MCDLIDRQAVLKQVADRIEAAAKWHEDCIVFEDEAGKTASYRALIDFNEIRLMVESLPSAEPERKTERWIPCSERLPDEEKRSYWVCTNTGVQCACRWTNAGRIFANVETDWHWNISDYPQYSEVVAWMPLPEPYKAESEDKE